MELYNYELDRREQISESLFQHLPLYVMDRYLPDEARNYFHRCVWAGNEAVESFKMALKVYEEYVIE